MNRSISICALGLLSLLVACSGGRETRGPGEPAPVTRDGGAGGGRDGGGGGGGEYGTCCVNNAFHSCADRAAFDQCVGFDVDACITACSPEDFGCIDECLGMFGMTEPDPSACRRDTARDGECTTGGGSECVDAPTGARCDYDGDCATNNCVETHCYPNTVGSRCDYDSDCDSNNCSGGCCRGNGKGEACDYDGDCDSNNCYSGTCEGNGTGSGCDYDSDCDSNNCFSNRCQ